MFSYTRSTKSFSATVTDNARVATSDPRKSSRCEECGSKRDISALRTIHQGRRICAITRLRHDVYHPAARSPESCVQALAAEGLLVNQQVRLGDHVEANRANALPLGVRELVVVAKQMKSRPHGRQNLVQHGLPGVDVPSCRVERTRRFV